MCLIHYVCLIQVYRYLWRGDNGIWSLLVDYTLHIFMYIYWVHRIKDISLLSLFGWRKGEMKCPHGLNHIFFETLQVNEFIFWIWVKTNDEKGRNCNFPFLGWERGGGRWNMGTLNLIYLKGGKASRPGWLNCNSSLYLKGKRAYILSKIYWHIRGKLQNPFFGRGKGRWSL